MIIGSIHQENVNIDVCKNRAPKHIKTERIEGGNRQYKNDSWGSITHLQWKIKQLGEVNMRVDYLNNTINQLDLIAIEHYSTMAK